MSTTDISDAYNKAAAQVLAQVHAEVAEITAAAQTISQEAKQEEDKNALATLRAKLFGMKP